MAVHPLIATDTSTTRRCAEAAWLAFLTPLEPCVPHCLSAVPSARSYPS